MVLPHTTFVSPFLEFLSRSTLIFAGLSAESTGEVAVSRPEESGDVPHLLTSKHFVLFIIIGPAERCCVPGRRVVQDELSRLHSSDHVSHGHRR